MVRVFKLLIILVITALVLALPSKVSAQNQFISNIDVKYEVEPTGITKITNDITLINSFSNIYAVNYTLTLDSLKPANIQAFQGNDPLKFTTQEEGSKFSIKVEFPDSVVGKGAKRRFQIIFENKDLAVKTGEVWEISIPKLADQNSFNNYIVSLSVPASFGQPAYISPKQTSFYSANNNNVYVFDKLSVSKNGITAAFGQFQVFSFNLIYHLENPLNTSTFIEIAIPPDTAYQKVNYEEINPLPTSVRTDKDGNWLAKFNLKPRERLDVTTKGTVQIFPEPRNFIIPSQEVLDSNLKPTEVWQKQDPQIIALANKLKTPRAIYDFVVSTLSYDYSRVTVNSERFGAIKALSNPKSAICTEFTDLFIAIARAAGIPAREVNGYAYTENPQIQPLSLVADVLHAWPEYWDKDKKVWVAIDPTWGSTTGIIDYFTKLDLRHFTFVVHGIDAKKPYPPGSYKLGPNPQKDVFVTFGQLSSLSPKLPQIEIRSKSFFPLANIDLEAVVKNTSANALYNKTVSIFFDEKKVKEEKFEILPPYGIFETSIKVPQSFLGQKTPRLVTVALDNNKVSAPTQKTSLIVTQIIIILLVIFSLLSIIYWKVVKFNIKKFYERLKNRFSNPQKPA